MISTDNKTHQQVFNWAHIHHWVSINVKQDSVNVSSSNFFSLIEFTIVSLLYALSCQTLFCQVVARVIGQSSTSSAILSKSTSDITGKHNKIRGITFRVTFTFVYLRRKKCNHMQYSSFFILETSDSSYSIYLFSFFFLMLLSQFILHNISCQ